jgi:DnaJ family protein C protein 28
MLNCEKQIQRAIQEGKFDHLEGTGKPLRFEDDALVEPDWRLANHLLRQNGFSPPWLELRKEIESDLERSLSALRAAYDWRISPYAQDQDSVELDSVWEQARQAFCQQIERLNRRIFEYNLQTPSSRFQIRHLNPNTEIALIYTAHKECC